MVFGTGNLGGKERKRYLERQRYINCGYCRYNRGENAKRRPRPDRYKNIDRESIRRECELEVSIPVNASGTHGQDQCS